MNDEAVVFHQQGFDAVAGDGVAAGSELDAAAVAAAHADGGNFYAVALGLAAGDFGNVHGHGYGGEPAHAHVVEDVFETGVFAAEIVEIALLEVFGEQEFLGQQGGEGALQ